MKNSALLILVSLCVPTFGQDATSRFRTERAALQNQAYSWSINLGASGWNSGAGRGQFYRALTAQAGRRFNHLASIEAEGTFGRADVARENIFSGSLLLTPPPAEIFPGQSLELGIVAGGSHFEALDFWAGYVAGRLSLSFNSHFALVGQYRRYVGMSNVAGSSYDVGSADPEDFSTLAASVRF